MLTSTLFSLSILPFCISLNAPPSPLIINNDPLTVFNVGNDTNPIHFYTPSSTAGNDSPNFGLATAWPPPRHRPEWLRPIPAGATMQILVSIIVQAFASLPAAQSVNKNFLTWGPEYRPNMNHLDTRIVIRQYRISEWGPGTIPRERVLKYGDVAAAAYILGNLYRTGEATTEDSWRMCFVDDRQVLARCSGVIMVQRDTWLRE
ncbi:MAG: hypothetical protein Q9169_004837 [Polycauliona sp. 2 TL-2023]